MIAAKDPAPMNPILAYANAFCLKVLELAEEHNLSVSAVAVDKGGHLIAVQRGDRTAFPSVEAARRKATASANTGTSTAALLHMMGGDPVVIGAMQASNDMLIVPGGYPMILNQAPVGGFGIAGGHYSEDVMLGDLALAAISAEKELAS